MTSLLKQQTLFWLVVLTAAFAARVVAQIVAGIAAPAWLPAFDAFSSGLIPYPTLLVAQIIILALQIRATIHIWRGRGYFAGKKPRGSSWMQRFAVVYVLVMVIRFFVTVWDWPAEPVSAPTIPIFFHWVLAAWLLVAARYYGQAREDA